MRIVDRAAFLAMPAGTLYAKFEPTNFGELKIKDETVVGADWYYQVLVPWPVDAFDTGSFFDSIDRVQAGAPCPPLDYDSTFRDGCFDQDQLFAVFEERDVVDLIARLQRALADQKAKP